MPIGSFERLNEKAQAAHASRRLSDRQQCALGGLVAQYQDALQTSEDFDVEKLDLRITKELQGHLSETTFGRWLAHLCALSLQLLHGPQDAELLCVIESKKLRDGFCREMDALQYLREAVGRDLFDPNNLPDALEFKAALLECISELIAVYYPEHAPQMELQEYEFKTGLADFFFDLRTSSGERRMALIHLVVREKKLTPNGKLLQRNPLGCYLMKQLQLYQFTSPLESLLHRARVVKVRYFASRRFFWYNLNRLKPIIWISSLSLLLIIATGLLLNFTRLAEIQTSLQRVEQENQAFFEQGLQVSFVVARTIQPKEKLALPRMVEPPPVRKSVLVGPPAPQVPTSQPAQKMRELQAKTSVRFTMKTGGKPK